MGKKSWKNIFTDQDWNPDDKKNEETANNVAMMRSNWRKRWQKEKEINVNRLSKTKKKGLVKWTKMSEQNEENVWRKRRKKFEYNEQKGWLKWRKISGQKNNE